MLFAIPNDAGNPYQNRPFDLACYAVVIAVISTMPPGLNTVAAK